MRRWLLWLWTALGVSCALPEDAVRQEIRQANTCNLAADCVDLGAHCPFGCNVLVHRSQAGRLAELLRTEGNRRCLYACPPLRSISCDNGVCVPHYR
ncbi:MAG: hypothetical protein RMK29_19910 [Myxococcales bacterium]|nr:hypothetical protein [Myxococcota bacterium]MDW8283975.1 hypothetical protein [Myxococcales bacterium]